jgi:hypothetical protein
MFAFICEYEGGVESILWLSLLNKNTFGKFGEKVGDFD